MEISTCRSDDDDDGDSDGGRPFAVDSTRRDTRPRPIVTSLESDLRPAIVRARPHERPHATPRARLGATRQPPSARDSFRTVEREEADGRYCCRSRRRSVRYCGATRLGYLSDASARGVPVTCCRASTIRKSVTGLSFPPDRDGRRSKEEGGRETERKGISRKSRALCRVSASERARARAVLRRHNTRTCRPREDDRLSTSRSQRLPVAVSPGSRWHFCARSRARVLKVGARVSGGY